MAARKTAVRLKSLKAGNSNAVFALQAGFD